MKLKIRILGLALCGLAGCAPLEVYSPDKAPEYMTRRPTAFYRHGPAQPGEPDILRSQTFVQLLRKEQGYSVVQLSDGRSGYVDSEDIRLAPPTVAAVSEEKLFPERGMAPPLPEPDFSTPIDDVVPSGKPKASSTP